MGVARLRLVVADNDDDALELVALDLRLEGHDIVGAATGGDDAIALCRSEHPDVLVVDYRMPPGPDGVAVARAVRAEQPSIAVIVYSNYRDPAVMAAAADAGARFLPKGNLRALRRELRAVADS
jgi:CheY-like chemotaxis protein